jgi:DNA-directed RNA polymerase subunit RPC12/RpoP
MESLVWTRGRNFPLEMLKDRLRCPRCGSRYVRVLFEPAVATKPFRR